MYSILVCDDEKDIVEALTIYLESEGYNIYKAYNGVQAVEMVENNDIQLVLLDIMMPEMDGITAMNMIRKKSNLPIILLTAKGEDTDKVLGLSVGADDYITKPFNPVEVIARVKAQLRRYITLGSSAINDKKDKLIIRGIELDDKAKSVTSDGNPIALTPIEYKILKLLMENPGVVYSPKQIYREVWQDAPLGAEGTVAVHIRHLR